jgi:hypothetical protein
MSLFHGKMGLAGLLLLAITILTVSASQGGTITENFANNQYNKNLWYPYTVGPGSSVSVTNNRLEITLPQSPGGILDMGGGGSNFTLGGNFEAQVDFDLLTWPSNNEAQITLSINNAYDFSINRRSRGLDPEGGGEIYFTMIKGVMTQVSASGTSGKLKMKRIGNKMEGFYWDGANWQLVGSSTDSTLGVATNVNLNLNRDTLFDGPIVSAAFDNILIHTPDSPALLQLLLLD